MTTKTYIVGPRKRTKLALRRHERAHRRAIVGFKILGGLAAGAVGGYLLGLALSTGAGLYIGAVCGALGGAALSRLHHPLRDRRARVPAARVVERSPELPE
jgi:hypothetical protein